MKSTRHDGSGRPIQIAGLAFLLLATLAALPSLLRSRAIGLNGDRTDVLIGHAVSVGRGSAWAFLTLRDGVPMELGVSLSERALTGPPTGLEAGAPASQGDMDHEYVLRLPSLNPTPYRHVIMRWNPRGHEPAGIYDVPHFDFYFFTITDEERRRIDPRDAKLGREAARPPSPEYVPEGYVPSPQAPASRFGMRWLDAAGPQTQDHVFTTGFAYGSWDGRIVFAEVMATLKYLQGRPDLSAPLAAARSYDPPGYYPSSYSVNYDSRRKRYRIALQDFVLR